MRTLKFFKILFLFSGLFSLGIPLSIAQKMGISSQTRAVVIGISDYQDERIPDLKFAHRDAKAFVEYLRSPSGGSLTKESVRLLTNESATAGQIFSALDWLINESTEDDKVIIYFAGHGDVETKTIRQRGYLLAHDTPANNYRVGSIGLDDVNDIVATLSTANKAEIILITDACHSGQLAGNNINGTQATAAALMNQFAKEVKIMSCQPDEYSQEGKEWGGGRGLFSYHLVEGLIGLADQDKNEQISLREIERYLEDEVSREAAPARQTPLAVGNKMSTVSLVNADALATLESQKSQQIETMAAVGNRSNFGTVALSKDSTVQVLYAAFEQALKQKYFLPSDRQDESFDGLSASELYDTLIQIPSLQALQASMKNNFAAALQDESHQAIIAYLNADPEELKKRFDYQLSAYDRHPGYLKKATELLGPTHYLFEKLKAKQYYFEGLLMRLQGERLANQHYFDHADSLIQLALSYDDQAAYIHNELGMIQFEAAHYRAGIPHFQQAITLAPTWILPRMNLLDTYRKIGQFTLADSIGRTVHNLDNKFAKAYIYRADNFNSRNGNKPEKELKVYLDALEIIPNHPELNGKLGLFYADRGEYDKAKVYLERAVELDSTVATYLINLATVYMEWDQLNWEQAIPLLQKAVSLDSTNFFAQFNLGTLYSWDKQHEQAILQFKNTIYLIPQDVDAYVSLAYEQIYVGQFDEALETLNLIETLFPGNKEVPYGMACWHTLQGQLDKALPYLEQSIQRGIDLARIESDGDLDALRQHSSYQDLVKRLFPD